MYEQSTTNQFILYIPSEISSDSNLNLSEMRVLATIKALDKDKSCFATNSYMAECLNISTRQVSRIISSLEKKGYILVENKNSFKRKIKVQLDQQPQHIQQEVVPVAQKKAPSVPQARPNKIEKFNAMYTHNWDFDEIEQLERNYIDQRINNMTLSDRGRELINKTKEYSDEPTEWKGISQLTFKEGATCKPKELAYQ